MTSEVGADAWAEGADRAAVLPDLPSDVPAHLDVLPDGRATVVVGDVAGRAEFSHQQGQNDSGFQGTCGLCSCESVLRQFDVPTTESEVVDHAVRENLCAVGTDAEHSGGTSPEAQAQILRDFGIPAHVEGGGSLESLAAQVEQDRGVIIEANAGVLWNDADYYEFGQANHAVAVTGVARDPASGALQGFFINDSGSGQAGRYVDAADMTSAWLDAGGTSVVTDGVRTGGDPR